MEDGIVKVRIGSVAVAFPVAGVGVELDGAVEFLSPDDY